MTHIVCCVTHCV